MDIPLSRQVVLKESELEWHAILAQGKGGQNVNKVATAIHLRFDIKASSLPEAYKERLLALKDSRLTQEGVFVIKAQKYRSQEKNLNDAIERLVSLIKAAMVTQKKRRATKPSRAAKAKRMDNKTKRGKTKALRKPPV